MREAAQNQRSVYSYSSIKCGTNAPIPFSCVAKSMNRLNDARIIVICHSTALLMLGLLSYSNDVHNYIITSFAVHILIVQPEILLHVLKPMPPINIAHAQRALHGPTGREPDAWHYGMFD